MDLLVSLCDSSARRVAELTARLERQLDREVQLVRLEDADSIPLLMADALERGRVLVDRDEQWPQLKAKAAMWHRRAAAAEVSLLDSMESLDDVALG